MSGSFIRQFNSIIIILIILIFFISIFFIPVMGTTENTNIKIFNEITISNSGFVWPLPGYTTITSYFGKRNSPTSGASSYHKGIDIGAPENSQFVAVVGRKNNIYRFFRRRGIHNNIIKR